MKLASRIAIVTSAVLVVGVVVAHAPGDTPSAVAAPSAAVSWAVDEPTVPVAVKARAWSVSRSIARVAVPAKPAAKPKLKTTYTPKPKPKPTATYSATPPTYTSTGKPWATNAVRLCIRHHESTDNYKTNTGNHYYGAYQFSRATWHAVTGLSGTADQYPPAVQDAAFMKLANAVTSSASMQNQFTTWQYCH